MLYIVSELERRLSAMIQAGTVEQVDHEKARCRIRVGDWVSAPLPWLTLASGAVRHWRPPSVGEQALLVSPSGEVSAGFVLPGFYSAQHGQSHEQRAHVAAWRMPDGCQIEYDWQRGALSVDGPKIIDVKSSGKVTLQCAELLVDSPRTTIKGALSVQGDLSVDGDVDASGAVMDSGGNSNHHTH